jgi:TonB family protein
MDNAAVLENWKGQVVDGRFQLLEWLGGSARGGVFLTELGEQGSQKATVRLIPEDGGNIEALAFRWEAMKKLSHPHLIRIFHTGQCQINAEQLFYVVMEYAEEDLSQVLPSRPLTPAETLEMLRTVVDVLSFVHENGFVHGHIQPSNIRAVDDRLKLSGNGLYVSGKPGGGALEPSEYDAPEIATGALSPAADVWSLGMTLVAALTQHPPAWERSGQRDPIVPESMPQPFRDIARECLPRDPSRRCTLGQIRARLQSPSPPPKATESVTETRSKPRAGGLLYAVLALAVLVVGLKLFSRRQQTNQETERKEQPVAAVAPLPSPPVKTEPVAQTTRGIIKGAVAERVLPDVSRSARNTIEGKVKVKVGVVVNSAGEVSEATLDNPGPSEYFANLALQAAKRWKFKPAQVNGQAVSSRWTLRFQFGRQTTDAVPTEVAP